jgi:hypothetical protein
MMQKTGLLSVSNFSMKIDLKTIDFGFEYLGSNYTENAAIKNGFKQLTGEDLREKIINKLVYGDYPMGYKFVSEIYENGKTEGINSVGTHDFGNWTIDFEKHTLHLIWNNGWIDTITRAYVVNGTIEFYDVDTGYWRTTFRKFINW